MARQPPHNEEIDKAERQLDALFRQEGYARGGRLTAAARRHPAREAEIVRERDAHPRNGAVVLALAERFSISGRQVRKIYLRACQRRLATDQAGKSDGGAISPEASPVIAEVVVDQAPQPEDRATSPAPAAVIAEAGLSPAKVEPPFVMEWPISANAAEELETLAKILRRIGETRWSDHRKFKAAHYKIADRLERMASAQRPPDEEGPSGSLLL